ncbi:hypothetical protein ABGB14_49460 [Nonomuraea sp. B10E15]|uniref:hypothetical protein n=1 Tax=Nonomuraea sp. B10E15 TaxID=3153560 RepID=UPI00325CB8DE
MNDATSDRAAQTQFRVKIKSALSKQPFTNYFARGLVNKQAVLDHSQWKNAFRLAASIRSYKELSAARGHTERARRSVEQLHLHGDINRTTVIAAGSLCVLLVIVATEFFRNDTGVVLACMTLGGACLYRTGGYLYTWRHGRIRFAAIKAVGLTSVAACVLMATWVVFEVEWRPWRTAAVVALSSVNGYLLQKPGALNSLTRVLTFLRLIIDVMQAENEEEDARLKWEEDLPDIAASYANYIINMLLGADAQKYLVEQDIAGLRKLYDANLTVQTSWMTRVERSLNRLDGGSIAIAGPRGVGKTTLLRTMSESQDHLIVQVSAPAEYLPKEFLAELFQRVCQEYLRHGGYEGAEIFSPNLARRKHLIRLLRETTTATVRSIASIGLLALVLWTIILENIETLHGVRDATIAWSDAVSTQVLAWWVDYPIWFKVALLVIAALLWPGRIKWRSMKWYSEPELVVRAREYIFRLQIDRTVTRAYTVGLTMPYGTSGSVNKGSTLKHLPWSLPELVGNLRRFMEDISKDLGASDKSVIVTIDEIDRIGSLEKAERFISEIKAVFGIDNCYFLVSVAEDVGTVFGQRALAGKSVFETAFDEVVLVDPLDLDESHLLLQRRVLGFGDAFVYLMHSLSGGLPRELLRCTRRLVEINAEIHHQRGQWPVLQELAVALVNEEMLELLTGARSHISRSCAKAENGYALDLMRVSIHSLRKQPPSALGEVRVLLEPLVNIGALAPPGEPSDSGDSTDNDAPWHTLAMVGVFAHFCLTIAEVFSDGHFDAAMASNARSESSLLSFDELAAIRRELSASYASCQISLERFRRKWGLELL